MPLIQAGAAPQDLDIFTRFGGALADPLSITFSIISPTGMLAPSGVAGFKRSVGHYDARDFGNIPSGLDPTPWTICWSITSPAGVVSSATESFSVATAIDASFTNIDNLVDQIEIDLGLESTDFTQTQYETIVLKALNRLNRKLGISGTTSELTIDQTDSSIQPTPSTALHDLILLQADCIIAKNLRRTAIGKGIRVKDGPSEIDTTASFSGQDQMVRDFCDELNTAVAQYLSDLDGADQHGELITYDNTRIFTDSDHDGDGDGRTRDYRSPFDVGHGFGNRGT